jgi:plasmid stabilization system protein ParE
MIEVVPRPEFVAAVEARIGWLGEHRPEDQLDAFLAGLTAVRDRIARHPRAGRVVRKGAGYTLRLRLFPRPLPYLVYYAHANDEPLRKAYLVRLYASGQRRREVNMKEWPW